MCRSCGAALGTGSALETGAAGGSGAAGPITPIPTDQQSLTSIGATVGVIIVAVVIGLVFSRVVPNPPRDGLLGASPSVLASIGPSGSGLAAGTPAPATPTPAPTQQLPGTVAFGGGLDPNTRQVVNPTTTFTANMTFAHSITLKAPFGVSQIGEEVVRINPDGSEKVMATKEENTLVVRASATVAGYTAPASVLIQAFGAGNYVMRVYRGTELLAQGTFTLQG